MTPPQTNFTKPTIGAGVFYRAEKYYPGFSMPRLLNIAIDDGVSTSTRYKRHFYFSGGFIIDRFNSIKIKHTALVRVVDKKTIAVDLNTSVLLANMVWVGASLRNFNAFGLNAQLEVNNKFRLGYLYELPTNNLSGSTHGTHEFMLSIDLELFKDQVAPKRYF